jgi:hypothetical protein
MQKGTEPLPLATVIGGRFQIQSFVRAEAGTELYQALDTRDNAPALLRLFQCPAAARPILEGDLTHAAGITHKNLCTLLAWGYEGNRVYLATEPPDGATLRQIVRFKKGPEPGGWAGPRPRAAWPRRQRDRGGVPAGLPRWRPPPPFGWAIPDGSRSPISASRAPCPRWPMRDTPEGATTSPYLAPEVVAGAAPSPAADVFSLTAVLYELVTGHAPTAPPWPATQVNSDLPKGIDKIIDRGLASLPETRFARPVAAHRGSGNDASPTSAPKKDPALATPRLTLGKSFSVSDAVRISEEYERWLIQKDNLDFGPFSLAQVMAQMEKGSSPADNFIVDADSGDRQKIKEHPQLAEFTRVVERKLEAQRRTRAELCTSTPSAAKGRWTVLIIGLAVLVVAGGMTFYLRIARPAESDVLASRVSEADVDKFLNGVKVEFAQPKHAAGGGGRRRPGGGIAGRAEDFNNAMDYGDVSKDGGDAILDEGTIDRVMRANYRKIVPCAMQSGARTVELDFVVQPTGRVKAVQVNGQRSGAMPVCILNQMQSFGFPQYKGKNTIASWSMSFR